MCNDPFVTYLKDFGYSVIRLPRRNFGPLQLLVSHRKELQDIGTLSTVVVPGPGTALPAVSQDAPATSIAGQRTSDLSLGVGLSILTGIIGAMGGGTLGIEARYERARTIAFEFPDVLVDSVEIAALDQCLGGSDVDPRSKHVGQLLDADEVYVVTATIKSRAITVDAKASAGASVAVDVPAVGEIVGAKVDVSAASGATGSLTYRASEPLVFGFQAVRLFYDAGRYTAFEPLEPGRYAARGLEGATTPKALTFRSDGTFARI